MKNLGLIAIGFMVGMFASASMYFYGLYAGNIAVVSEASWTVDVNNNCNRITFSSPKLNLVVHRSVEPVGSYGSRFASTVTRQDGDEKEVILAKSDVSSYMGRKAPDQVQDRARRVCDTM